MEHNTNRENWIDSVISWTEAIQTGCEQQNNRTSDGNEILGNQTVKLRKSGGWSTKTGELGEQSRRMFQ